MIKGVELRACSDGFEIRYDEDDGSADCIQFILRFGKWECDAEKSKANEALEFLIEEEKNKVPAIAEWFKIVQKDCCREKYCGCVSDLIRELAQCPAGASIDVYLGNGEFAPIKDIDAERIKFEAGQETFTHIIIDRG